MTLITPLLLLLTLAASPAEDGLWRLSVPEDPEVVFYLFMEEDAEPNLYDSAWRPRYLDEVKVDGAHMYLRTIPTSNLQMFQFEIAFEGTEATGRMKSRVMQYENVKGLEGVRLSSPAPVLPEQAMESVRREGPEDLARDLCSKAGEKSSSEFQEYWANEVFPRYYVVLEPLYFSRGIDPANEAQYVQKVYEQVRAWDVEDCLPAVEEFFAPEADASATLPGQVLVKLPSALIDEEALFTFATVRNVDRCCSQPEFLTEEVRLVPFQCQSENSGERTSSQNIGVR